MSDDMLIGRGDKLHVVTRQSGDGTNDGSIIVMRGPGHAYCIAKAPRFASDEEWSHNARLLTAAAEAAVEADPVAVAVRVLNDHDMHEEADKLMERAGGAA